MADGEAGDDRGGLDAAERVFSRSLMRSSSVGTFFDSTSSSCTLFRLETSRFRVVCSSRTRLCLRRRVSSVQFCVCSLCRANWRNQHITHHQTCYRLHQAYSLERGKEHRAGQTRSNSLARLIRIPLLSSALPTRENR